MLSLTAAPLVGFCWIFQTSSHSFSRTTFPPNHHQARPSLIPATGVKEILVFETLSSIFQGNLDLKELTVPSNIQCYLFFFVFPPTEPGVNPRG
ncbi:hypothetical protein R3P38DRAFT_1023893 [Favolaschia claudopus]|uniref:Secreted protein n=1 Tax=Favolaschia claudopus TaxID=2862362 RepID=A0AAW0BIF8_9AGAR